MHKIYIPAINASYVEHKVYNISTSSDVISSSFVTIIAPDPLSAVQAFAFLYPSADIVNMICVGPCVSLFPLSLHE